MSGNTKKLRLVYFAGEGVFSTVLDSQVLVPLRLLGAQAPPFDRSLVCLTSVRHRHRGTVPARLEEIEKAVPGARCCFAYRPFLGVPFQHLVWARKLNRAFADWSFGPEDRIILHCRGHYAGAAAACVKRSDPRVRVLVDMRGDPLDELPHGGLVGAYYRGSCKRALTRALAAADGLNTVTERLFEVLAEGGYVDRQRPRVVIGCCVDRARFYFDPEVRALRRSAWGLDGKFVLCYCGGMAPWQRPDAIAELAAAVLSRMPDAHMLVVSREAEVLVRNLVQAGISSERITAREVSQEEVPSCLMAADVGLLLRENTRTNQVASPVKFAEYLACGLPVILTPYIGDLGDLVEREKIGKTITFPVRADEAVAAVQYVRDHMDREGDDCRRRCSGVAHAKFTWESGLTPLVELYEKLLE